MRKVLPGSQKEKLNHKNVLHSQFSLIANLNEGVDRQAKRIEILGTNIRNLQTSVPVEGNNQIKREITAKLDEKDKYINEVIQQIMNRIQGFEETLKNIPKIERNP